MRSFRQILWRHVYRFGIPQLVLIAVGMLFVEWHYDQSFRASRKSFGIVHSGSPVLEY